MKFVVNEIFKRRILQPNFIVCGMKFRYWPALFDCSQIREMTKNLKVNKNGTYSFTTSWRRNSLQRLRSILIRDVIYWRQLIVQTWFFIGYELFSQHTSDAGPFTAVSLEACNAFTTHCLDYHHVKTSSLKYILQPKTR